MKTILWKKLLSESSFFSGLKEEEFDNLLDDRMSTEEEYSPDTVIIRQGESATSFFLIGAGSVNVTMATEGDKEIPIATLGVGELFGEMALLAHKPTSATVIANERCVLLKIKGEDFLSHAVAHPDIEFKLISKLRQRLGQLSERAMTFNLTTVEEKMALLNTKLDAQLHAMDASLRSANSVLAQTTDHAEQLIAKLGRSYAKLMVSAGIVGAVMILVIGGSTWIGYANVQTILTLEKAVTETAESMFKLQGSLASELWFTKFNRAVEANDRASASNLFGRILALPSNESTDSTLKDYLFTRLEAGISTHENGGIYQHILDENLPRIETPHEKIRAHYLLLVSLLFDDNKKLFDSTLSQLDEYLQQHESVIAHGTFDLSLLDEMVFVIEDHEKQSQAEQIKALLLAKTVIE